MLCNIVYAKDLVRKFSFSRFMDCGTEIIAGEGVSVRTTISSKKVTWLELEKKNFDVYLYKSVYGPDKLVRKTKAKCEGVTKIDWESLASGTYYLKFEKARDGQLLEGTVTYHTIKKK